MIRYGLGKPREDEGGWRRAVAPQVSRSRRRASDQCSTLTRDLVEDAGCVHGGVLRLVAEHRSGGLLDAELLHARDFVADACTARSGAAQWCRRYPAGRNER